MKERGENMTTHRTTALFTGQSQDKFKELGEGADGKTEVSLTADSGPLCLLTVKTPSDLQPPLVIL